MKYVWNPIFEDGQYFDERDTIDFYGYAQKFIFSQSIVVIPAPISNPELTEQLKTAFTDAGFDYDKIVYDYEDMVKGYKEDGLLDEDIDPLFSRGSMPLPIVILGHKYAVSAQDVITALKYQTNKNTLIMFNTDWAEVYAIEKWANTLIKKRTKNAEAFNAPPPMPTPWEIAQHDDLGLDPDEWDSLNQLDDDGSRYHISFQRRRGYVVPASVKPVDEEAPWSSYLPMKSEEEEDNDLPF